MGLILILCHLHLSARQQSERSKCLTEGADQAVAASSTASGSKHSYLYAVSYMSIKYIIHSVKYIYTRIGKINVIAFRDCNYTRPLAHRGWRWQHKASASISPAALWCTSHDNQIQESGDNNNRY